jgi:uncharacterized metal-binding protein
LPRDEVHVIVGVVVLIPVLHLAWERLSPSDVLLFTLAYLFSLLWLSPDLDLDRGSRSMRRWGILAAIWVPYAKLMRHRGLSHSLFAGFVTRLAYLAVFLLPVISLIDRGLNLNLSAASVGVFVLGMWVPHALHVLLDRLDEALGGRL